MPDAHGRRWRRIAGCAVASLCAAVLTAGCAARATPAPPALQPARAPAYPEFHYPTVPVLLKDSRATAALDRGWRYLQANDVAAAQREFASALRADQAFYPALAAEGYAALVTQDYAQALQSFDAALAQAGDYLPALVGRGRALLADDRLDDAAATLAAATGPDPAVEDLRSRVEVLRFRRLQSRITDARAAAAAGTTDAARAAYEAAIAASPESGFLFRELASVDRAAGDDSAAVTHVRRAIELDASDASAWLELGALLERQDDLAAALRAYAAAAELQPTPELSDKTASLTRRAREAQLPAPFKAMAAAAQISRGDLAALIGIRLESLLAAATKRPVLLTDTRGHWAAAWITAVVDGGVMTALDNHTFQPSAGVRRVDLAEAAARLLRLINPSPRVTAARATARPAIADVRPSHLNFAAIADVVSAGVMPLLEGRRFLVSRPVSGAEAIEVVGRIQALLGAAP